MPVMDGLESARRMRAELPAAAQPAIVALTANAYEADREACRAAGMEHFLSKPVRLDDLRDAVSRFL
jgi:CheY-like chemotaxis protein